MSKAVFHPLGTALKNSLPMTFWFPPEIKPVRDGWYKTRFLFDMVQGYRVSMEGWSYWHTASGKWSGQYKETKGLKPREFHATLGARQDKSWCGLYKEPQQ